MADRSDPKAGAAGTDFIRAIVQRDMEAGKYDRVVTRFPPEPNGFLHIGHSKAILLSHSVAREWEGRFHLRFDDTNPLTEDEVFTESMKEDIRWLGCEWDELCYASDYFERMYECGVTLIEKGSAYVDSQSEAEIRRNRGTVTEPGVASPDRDRPVEESRDLFRRMRAGEFGDGELVLRGRIDLAHPNMIMRDPVFFRIRHAHHYRQGDDWCLYPLYDFAHCLEDAFEGITHSFCTLEFENNREIYDWILDEVGFEEPRPHQYEFARLELEYTLLSKRKLRQLVEEGRVDGWDDPRMPTIRAFRRRGVPASAIRAFCDMVGVTKANTRVDPAMLEYAIRDELNEVAPRVLAVLEPLKVTITNFEGDTDWLDAPYFPRDVGGDETRKIPFDGELLIERGDFMEDPPEDFYRLAPGREVRLRYGYFITCEEVVKDESGRVVELRCSYDPETRGGDAPDGRKVKGTLHWVSAAHALAAEVRLYDRLFLTPDPEDAPDGKDFHANLNPESLVVAGDARVEPSVADDPEDTRYQFERNGYFWRDPEDSTPDALVFNRIVTLRDSWAARRAAGGEEVVKEEKPDAERGEAKDAPSGGGPPGISEERTKRREADPELAARFQRYQRELSLSPEDADVLTGSRGLSDFFQETLVFHDVPGTVSAWIVNELRRELKERPLEDLPFGPEELARLVIMVDEDRVSRIAAKDIFGRMVEEGGDPRDLVREMGLEKLRDRGALLREVDEVLAAWPDKVAEYREGKTGLLGFFIGRVMDKTGGTADPKLTRTLLSDRLEG